MIEGHGIDRRLVLSPSDLTGYLACPHLARLELAAARGEIDRAERRDPELDVLAARGGEHERRHLERLRAEGRQVVEIDTSGHGLDALRETAAATAEAMRSGAEVVYQATFFEGRWRGQADFVCRVERPSRLGTWSYEVADAKLARRVKAAAILQLCSYSEHVSRIQGTAPELIHVVGGDQVARAYRLADYAAYHRRVKASFEQALDRAGVETYPEPVGHCGICRWAEVCDRRRRRDDHLSLVAGMRRGQAGRLAASGVRTVEELASSPPQEPVAGIAPRALDRLRLQARLQLGQRRTGRVGYELVDPLPAELGLGALPVPSPGDLFFDMEGDPFAGDDGLEYLFGVVEVSARQPRYHAFWAHGRAEEAVALERFVDLVMARLERHPDLHVYHYGSYETSAVKRLMGAHATREQAVDRLLRGGVFVDLHRVVRQGLVVSQESYSIKRLEPLYMAARDGAITDAGSSIVAYEGWLESGDQSRLEEIAEYNRADCESTRLLRGWLEERRAEAEDAGRSLPRPYPGSGEPSPEQAGAEAETEALVTRLTFGLPEDPDSRTPAQAATWLLAQLLDWHRREDKPEWWAHYARLELSDAELVDDPESIGELRHVAVVGEVDRSLIHRYGFRPGQEHKVSVGDTVVDPRTGTGCGTVHALDDTDCLVELRRGRSSAAPHPSSLVPQAPRPTTVLRQALAGVAEWVADNGIDAPGPHRAVRDLLLALPPRFAGRQAGGPLQAPDEPSLEATRRLAVGLEGTCLPVQGPPGSGKTWTAARMILDLVQAGRRVGITAATHKAITNLVDAVCWRAADTGVSVSVVQKAEAHQASSSPVVEAVASNPLVAARLADGGAQVGAGTPWLFARPELSGAVDVLFVDEAGQMSLANVVAAGAGADSIVLLGDPQQLAQPSKGSHPPGVGVSALEHLLGEHATIPAERGLFLATTWRLHPELCRFVSEAFYEGRLRPDPACCAQRLDEGPWAGGSGVRWRPVHHAGNRTSSCEEAAEVQQGIDCLVGREWTDREGRRRAMGLDDILVVAPYNAQVARLRRALPEGARVGTVDRFQGQQAPAVIFSMATSSADDIPRSVEFLYSLNRLNVAVSRAQALFVLVCSPDLLRVRCRTPREMRLANALCRLAELAGISSGRACGCTPATGPSR